MRGALKAVAEGMGVNRAAMEYGVPRTTLKDRVAGRVQHDSNSGRAPYLTSSETIAIMKAKKQDNIIAKENRKKERGQKKLRDRRKAEEREHKLVVRQRKAPERERKATERKREAQERALKKKANAERRCTRIKRVSNKENKAPVDDSQGFQRAEINQNECAVGLGVCDDDLNY